MQGATCLPIGCATNADALVKKAAAARAVESTAMNAVSSRSHSVFTLFITGQHEASGQRLQGALNLVDLAGRCVISGLGSAQKKVSCVFAPIKTIAGQSAFELGVWLYHIDRHHSMSFSPKKQSGLLLYSSSSKSLDYSWKVSPLSRLDESCSKQ